MTVRSSFLSRISTCACAWSSCARRIPICDLSRVNRAYTIPDAEAFAGCRQLLREEGILAGTSSGTLIAAALRYCREQTLPRRVVTFVCDSGNKYLSKVYNDYWMLDQGFLERESFGDLRDRRQHRIREDVVVHPRVVRGPRVIAADRMQQKQTVLF